MFLLVRVFSFPSLYLVNDKIKIVIVASEVAKVETIEKWKCDVRKNTRQKKNYVYWVFLSDLRGFPDLLPDAMEGGEV